MKKHVVTNVRPLENFVVEVQFDHETVKKFDVKPYISGNWFGKLANQEIF